MNTNRRHAVAALIAAGLLWGTSVPLSKLALAWLSPGWLTATRFGLAAAVLAVTLLTTGRTSGRAKLRAAFTPKVLASGALGYGGSVIVQSAGISRTSVTHAALLIGVTPVLVAIIAAVWHRTVARPVAWVGFVVSLLGVGLVTVGGGGNGATTVGDGLVLASLFLGAAVTVAQGRLLTGRDPVAVTAVQFLGAAVGALLVTVFMEGAPAVPGSPGPVLAVLALTVGGTVLPFTLFAFGQSRVSAEVAGAFLNLEPLVGAIVGAAAFGDAVGLAQVAGGAAIVAGIGLSSLPLLAGRRRPAVAAGPLALDGAEPLALAGAEPTSAAARPALVGAGLAACESGTLPNRGELSKSHISPSNLARRLRIEVTTHSDLPPAVTLLRTVRASGSSRQSPASPRRSLRRPARRAPGGARREPASYPLRGPTRPPWRGQLSTAPDRHPKHPLPSRPKDRGRMPSP